MIVITGAAGFIGSCLVGELNKQHYNDLILVDDFSREDKKANWENKKYTACVDRNELENWLEKNQALVQFVFHLGARTDTTEMDYSVHEKLNVAYSKMIWKMCVKHGFPLVYASSAATYGLGENGYNDNETNLDLLKPLNPYGESKNNFDKWALAQTEKPYSWKGLKFFNVYGPNEYHKGRMASVIMHGYNQIQTLGKIKLFKSHKEGYKDGEQKRDFIYVKDIVKICMFLMVNRKTPNGIYNAGSGEARTFLDLAKATFKAANKTEQIEFIDTPIDIRDKYQYFTEANMEKLKSIGYEENFYSLEDGVQDYVSNYLKNHLYA